MENEARTLYEIPEENYAKFEAELKKLSKRSLRIAGYEILPVVFGYEMKKDKNGQNYKVFNVLLNADVPRIDGYTFVATLDHSLDTGNIVRNVPNTGIAVPEKYRSIAPLCDHCGIKRQRNNTFLLRCDDTSEFKQVGSSCLKDFFGHDPLKIARMAEYLGYADELARGSHDFLGGQFYFSLEEFLGHAAWAVRKFGWISGKAARENDYLISTRESALDNMMPPKNRSVERISDADIEMASKALEWAQNICSNDNLSDYMSNLCVIATASMVTMKSLGLAASIIFAYQKEMNILAERKKAQDTSKHMGKVGDKLNLQKVRLTHHNSFDGAYGTTHIYKMQSEEGNVLTWFASVNQNLHVGDTFDMIGTVKKLDTFNGINQTVLTRCKIK